jgi:tRNA-Thr(GGU) m(6)t(6)A37 methyltransferase TsaA
MFDSKSTDTRLLSLAFLCGFAVASLYVSFVDSSASKISQLESLLEKEKKERSVERKGRINQQKLHRQEFKDSVSKEGYNMKEIAVIESVFPDRRGTPRQPLLVPAARARIRFNKKLIQSGHIAELQHDFSHLFILFVFHENTNLESHNNSKQVSMAKIAPPRLGGKKVGCLSTRSPHRPNPIGLSVCEILSVNIKECTIDIKGVDFVDGTPILGKQSPLLLLLLLLSLPLKYHANLLSLRSLFNYYSVDIKPYIPYDLVPTEIPLPMATDEHGQPLIHTPLKVPAWIYEADITMRTVTFTAQADMSLKNINESGKFKLCSGYQEARDLIVQVLRQDIRGVKQGKRERGTVSSVVKEGGGVRDAIDDHNSYMCRLDSMQVEFETNEKEIIVFNIT